MSKHFPVRGGFLGKAGVVRAVDDVSFSVDKGEVLGIVGESGCGKSTTARLVIGLIQPDAGSIMLDGEKLGAALSLRDLRRRVQMVFQDSYASLNPRLTVEASIAFGPIIHGISSSEARERAHDLLRKVGLDPATFADRYPHELSGGQRQRVNIARALALSPRLVLLDEAVSALDKSVEAQVLNLLIDLKQDLGLTLRVHLARPQRGALHLGSRAGDVSRRGGRDRPGRGAVAGRAPPVYARAARRDALARSRQPHQGSADRRRSAQPDQPPVGLPLPHTLRVCRERVQREESGSVRHRQRPPYCGVPHGGPRLGTFEGGAILCPGVAECLIQLRRSALLRSPPPRACRSPRAPRRALPAR
jgi:ABC-type dipeptide/oligopeptide/nickel transport system ATPase subunit